MIHYNNNKAFSLVETITVLVIASMVLVSVIQIYNRVRGDAVRINERLDDDRLAMEVLQKIAEDVDRLAAPGFDASLTMRSRYNNGYTSSQLMLSNTFYDKTKRPAVYEQIIWQSSYDSQDETLVLYRSHSGLNLEDKIVEKNKVEEKKKEKFIPIAAGVTMFEVKAVQDGQVRDKWISTKMPTAIRVGISFAPLSEDMTGSLVVPEESILYRTIAIDRTRVIGYQLVNPNLDMSALDFDPNDLELQADNEDEAADAVGDEEKTDIAVEDTEDLEF